ncbi:hypothetical protein STXM2123_3292 [Streptomyces sp. F-3]|nr:hypothetical protein STXM2123_3292 [Streptomyces sp. F-3]
MRLVRPAPGLHGLPGLYDPYGLYDPRTARTRARGNRLLPAPASAARRRT